MNILKIMCCTSDQYASMERYIVSKAKYASDMGIKLYVAYDQEPKSEDFKYDLKLAGGEWLVLKSNTFFDLYFLTSLRKIVRQYDCSVVHAYFTPTCHYVMFSCFLLGINKRFRSSANQPLTLFKRINKESKLQLYLFYFKQRLLSLLSPKIICRSNAIKEEFVELGVSSQRLIVASGGTDTDKYALNKSIREDLRKELNTTPNEVVIGLGCRLVSIKNIAALINAIPTVQIMTERPLKVFIAGDGPELNSLKMLIKKLSLSDRIFLLGHRDDLSCLLNAFDIFAQPSFAEGMSNSVLEAMSCQLPVAVSNIAPNMEIFSTASDNNMNIGVTFDPDSVQDIAIKLVELIEDADRFKRGECGRYIVESFYSLQRRLETEFNIYKGVD